MKGQRPERVWNNQKKIYIKKRSKEQIIQDAKRNHSLWATIDYIAMDAAAASLSSNGLKAWLYLIRIKENTLWELSSKDAYEKWHFDRKAFNNAINELIDNGYLNLVTSSSYPNTWEFCEFSMETPCPKKTQGACTEKTQALVQKKPKPLGFENPTNTNNNTNNNTDKINTASLVVSSELLDFEIAQSSSSSLRSHELSIATQNQSSLRSQPKGKEIEELKIEVKIPIRIFKENPQLFEKIGDNIYIIKATGKIGYIE